MSDEINTGFDMWQDHKNQYGIITARIMCLRYLDLQTRSKDPEEHEFCRELREAMTLEKNFADKTLYRKSFDEARSAGEEDQFNDSDMANRWCAGEIDDAIRACEYQDGTHKLEPAAQALLEHYGVERLSFVLALDIQRYIEPYSDDNRAWAWSFDIHDSISDCGIRTHPVVLDELVTCLRETLDRTRGAELSQTVEAIVSPESNESEQNFAAWMAVTESSRFHWVEDEICRLNGRGAMYYTGGEDGAYMRIQKDGTLEAGKYEGAIPHIGNALFSPEITKQCGSFSEAYKTAMETGGKQFMVDMFRSNEPQPLFRASDRGAPEKKTSVLKQIRDAQKAPTPQGEKSPNQRKRKSETEH